MRRGARLSTAIAGALAVAISQLRTTAFWFHPADRAMRRLAAVARAARPTLGGAT